MVSRIYPEPEHTEFIKAEDDANDNGEPSGTE
jgi:hypothetical protein